MASILDNLPQYGAVAAGTAAALPVVAPAWDDAAWGDAEHWGDSGTSGHSDAWGDDSQWGDNEGYSGGGDDGDPWGFGPNDDVAAPPRLNIDSLLEGLNEQQAAAVVYQGGPLLIVAGAGSGKTRVLTHRIAYLIATKRAWPSQILAITFTNKAAAEMRERVINLIGAEGEKMWVSTFHSACVRILRREYQNVGLKSGFSIYDSADSLRLITLITKEQNLDPKKHPPRGLARKISDLKNELVTPKQYADSPEADQVLVPVYNAYAERLKIASALDFDDIIMKTVELLQKNPAVAEHYRRRFRHILVDEYQDTNHAQYMLIKELVGGPGSSGWEGTPESGELTVVGDADQSIYAFRGATIRNIEEFENDYPDAATILLEQNYRSTQNILSAANAVISKNSGRRAKNLWTSSGEGAKIIGYTADDEYGEARYIVSEIDRLGDLKEALPKDVAIFYRANAQSRAIEEILIRVGLPYKIVGGTRFYERKEIKDAVSYLHAIINPDDDINLRRIINEPKRGIGDRAEGTVAGYAAVNNISFGAALDQAQLIPGITSRTLNPLQKFAQLLSELRALPAAGKNPAEILEAVLDKTGYLAELKASEDPQDATRVENLAELVSVAAEFTDLYPEGTLVDFLERIALVADADQIPTPDGGEGGAVDPGVVTLMTLHTAKGLEFPVVFLTGLEDGTFPHMRSMYDAAELQEERRLAYVGLTRARERLYLTRSAQRSAWGNTTALPESRFLSDVPEELIDWQRRESATDSIRSGWGGGDYSGGYSAGRGSGYAGGGYAGGAHSGGQWGNNKGAASSSSSVSSSGNSSATRSTASSIAKRFGPKKEEAAAPKLPSSKPELEIPALTIGDRVSHDTYGLGKVVAVEGLGRNTVAKIDFGTDGVKRLLLRYTPLVKL